MEDNKVKPTLVAGNFGKPKVEKEKAWSSEKSREKIDDELAHAFMSPSGDLYYEILLTTYKENYRKLLQHGSGPSELSSRAMHNAIIAADSAMLVLERKILET